MAAFEGGAAQLGFTTKQAEGLSTVMLVLYTIYLTGAWVSQAGEQTSVNVHFTFHIFIFKEEKEP